VVVVGADVVVAAEGSTEASRKAWRGGPTGVEEQGMCTVGFPRNLGGPAVSAR
jgi:hypothetical protein